MSDLKNGAQGGGLRGLAARRPLTVFVALVLGFGWPLLSMMPLIAHKVISLGGLPPEVFVLVVNLGVMLPAALWVTSVVDGRAGVRALLSRAVRWRFKPIWWAIVLFAIPALTITAVLLTGGSFKEVDLVPVLAKQIASMLFAVLLINLWEETVWVGFLQTRLERRHNFFLAAVLTALPFAGVHIPLLLMKPFAVSSFLIDLGGLLVLAIIARVMWGVVLRGAANSTLAVGLMHGVFNASNNPTQLVDSFVQTPYLSYCAIGAIAVLAVLLVAFNRDKLSQAYRLNVADRI